MLLGFETNVQTNLLSTKLLFSLNENNLILTYISDFQFSNNFKK